MSGFNDTIYSLGKDNDRLRQERDEAVVLLRMALPIVQITAWSEEEDKTEAAGPTRNLARRIDALLRRGPTVELDEEGRRR